MQAKKHSHPLQSNTLPLMNECNLTNVAEVDKNPRNIQNSHQGWFSNIDKNN